MTARQALLHILASLLVLIVPFLVYAETKVLTAEATYTMGDGETPSFAEAMVLQKAKQVALEQAGTYVESYTKIRNLDLTNEEIQTIAGGVMQTDVLDKKRSLVGDGLQIYVKIRATVTTDKMEELATRIKGKDVAGEYKRLREEYVRLSEEIETWKQLLSKTPVGVEREAALDQIRERERTFEAMQKREDALFQRLVSGAALVKEAEYERAVVDALFINIVDQGHQLHVGEPTSHKTSGNHDNMKLRIPVAVRANKSIRFAMEEAASSLGGHTRITKFIRQYESEERETQGTIVRMGKDSEVARYFWERVSHLELVLTLALEDGQVLMCNDWRENENPRQVFYLETNPIVPVFAIYQRHISSAFGSGLKVDLAKEIKDGYVFGHSDGEPVRWIGSNDVLFAGKPDPARGHYSLYRFEPMSDPLVVVFEDVRSFIVTTVIPVSQARQIKTIRGEYAEKQAHASSPSGSTLSATGQRRKIEHSWWERIFSVDKGKFDPPTTTMDVRQQLPRPPEQISCTIER